MKYYPDFISGNGWHLAIFAGLSRRDSKSLPSTGTKAALTETLSKLFTNQAFILSV